MTAIFSNFPLAEHYTAVLPQQMLALRETSIPDAHIRWSERHLQAVWYDSNIRPAFLTSSDNETIVVSDPGRWNLEAGPDFLDTVLLVGSPPRRICGDTEIHIHPYDWDQHKHNNDPRYANVKFHVTYHPGEISSLPHDCIQLSLRDSLLSNRTFSFSDIDISAYPHGIISARPRPCRTALKQSSPEEWGLILEAAGQHRIERKTDRITSEINNNIPLQQIFYEEIMSALGYKQNQRAFRHLAQRLPYGAWDPDIDAETLYALMLGTAGLLPSESTPRDPDAKAFIRKLWDTWWKNGSNIPPLSNEEWILTGSRPVNHPRRRIAAAAALFTAKPLLHKQIHLLPHSDSPGEWIKKVKQLFARIACMPYWENRLTMHSAPDAGSTALIGDARISSIITNVVVPMLAAEGKDISPLLQSLPREHDNSIIRLTAERLLGRDVNPALYATGLKQQGLIQIYQDFCLNTRSDCDDCELAKQIRNKNNREGLIQNPS